MNEDEILCVCVCVRERERERESVCAYVLRFGMSLQAFQYMTTNVEIEGILSCLWNGIWRMKSIVWESPHFIGYSEFVHKKGRGC